MFSQTIKENKMFFGCIIIKISDVKVEIITANLIDHWMLIMYTW
jgi:hypothetical protein